MRKEKVAPLADEKIPSFVALGHQVASGPQLTPEQELAIMTASSDGIDRCPR
jgi:hypothetical protein